MCIASAYYEPWDPNSADDIKAADTKVTFEYGFYSDPLFFGKYPDIMRDYISDNRLPQFTDDEKQMLIGSVDFVGVNHYYSKYIHHTGKVGRDFSDDPRSVQSDTDKYGHLIGPYAESAWLTIYPEGFRKLLNWLDKRYDGTKIYVFENGVSVPGENTKPISEAVHDQFRAKYYNDYINQMKLAITEDGVDI